MIYGIRLLEVLRGVDGVETHLVLTAPAKRTVLLETDYTVAAVEALADHVHASGDIAAAISSGSFKTMGMAVVPCTIKTLSGIANCYSQNLLLRAADVALKDQRRLVLVLRETPLHLRHVQLMARAIEMGAVIVPPVPAFYHRPRTLDEIINQTVNRVLDLFDVELDADLFARWQGPAPSRTVPDGG